MKTGPKPTDPLERILARITIGPTGCWLYHRAYASVGGHGEYKQTYRWTYEHYVGLVPPGLEIDHLCRDGRCVNPDHLEAVTRSENALRGNTSTRRLVCREGHWILADNVYVYTQRDGIERRTCKICYLEKERVRGRRRYAARRSAATPPAP